MVPTTHCPVSQTMGKPFCLPSVFALTLTGDAVIAEMNVMAASHVNMVNPFFALAGKSKQAEISLVEQSCCQKSLTWRIFSWRYYHLESPLSPLKEFAWDTEQNCLSFCHTDYLESFRDHQDHHAQEKIGVGAGIPCRENCLSEQVRPSLGNHHHECG